MSQYPGGQPPQDPYYGGQPADPYAPNPSSQQPSDPYFGQSAGDPYAPPQDPAYGQQDPAYGQQDPTYAQQQQAYAQQQAYYAQQQAAWQGQQQPPLAESGRGRGGAGAAIIGLLLVLIGAWILFGDEVDLDFGQIWPIAAVAVGIVMVIAAFIPRRSS